MVSCGVVHWYDVVWWGGVSCDVVRCGTVKVHWYDVVCGIMWYGEVWYHVVRCGTVK